MPSTKAITRPTGPWKHSEPRATRTPPRADVDAAPLRGVLHALPLSMLLWGTAALILL